MKSGLTLAITAAGNQSKLARALGTSPQLISYWHNNIGRVPAEYVPAVSDATGLPRHVIRPDLYDAPGRGKLGSLVSRLTKRKGVL